MNPRDQKVRSTPIATFQTVGMLMDASDSRVQVDFLQDPGSSARSGVCGPRHRGLARRRGRETLVIGGPGVLSRALHQLPSRGLAKVDVPDGVIP